MNSFHSFLEYNNTNEPVNKNDINNDINNDIIIDNQPIKTNKNIDECKKFEEEFYKCYDKKGFEKCINIYNKYIFCGIKK